MKKDFDKWNIEKKKIDQLLIDSKFYFHERELWWCSFGMNIGIEIDGKNSDFERPVLIVKKFNGKQFWGIPLTTSGSVNKFHIELNHNNKISFAVLSQLRTFSSKRLLRKIGKISENQFEFVIEGIKKLLL